MGRIHTILRSFRHDETGVSAVEFAIMLPLLITLFFGGYAVTTTLAVSRKVTITTRALADLTSQYPKVAATDLSTIFNASTQVMAPFAATPLGMRLTEVTTDVTGLLATVTWSQVSGTGFSAYTAGSSYTLPLGMLGTSNISYIFSETTYAYIPPFGTTIVGAITFGDRIYMLPRVTTSIPYTG